MIVRFFYLCMNNYHKRMEGQKAARENTQTISFHEHQLKALQSEARFILLVAGTQGGKTTTGKWWIANEINKHPEDEYLVACPTYKIMGQSTLPRLLEILKLMKCGHWNEQRKEYLLNGGGKVYVRSTEDPDAIESMKCRAIWLDEVGKMKVRVWYACNSRVAILKGRIMMTTSPYNMGWVFNDIYKRKDVDPDYEVIQFASNANIWYPKEEWERQKRTLPEAEFKRRFGGEFVKTQGLVYEEFSRSIHVVEPNEIDVENLYKFCGMDIGYAAPTAVTFCGIDKMGNIYIYDEYYQSKGLLGDHANTLFNKGYKKGVKVFADKSAAQEIAELGNLGLSITACREINVNLGINKIKALFKNRKLFISSKCKNLIDELETYSWAGDEEDGDVPDKVIKKRDHLVDSMRYGIMSSQYMIPYIKDEKYNSRPTVHYDPLTGCPMGYEKPRSSLLDSMPGRGTILLSNGNRMDMRTGKMTAKSVPINLLKPGRN